jgi:hypothetical protein
VVLIPVDRRGDVSMKSLVFALVLALAAVPAAAQTKSCDELKTEIDEKNKKNGVKEFTLEIVPADQVKDATVVGSCEGGAKKITYKRGGA